MKIELTDREIELLMAALGTHIGTLEKHPNARTPMLAELITELFELETDLREAVNRQDDGWNVAVDAEINETPDAETEMFNAGVEAREKMKATSRAAGRRALKFRVGTAEDDRSEMQGVDVWDPNDPKNW
jgi:hypothetical protein